MYLSLNVHRTQLYDMFTDSMVYALSEGLFIVISHKKEPAYEGWYAQISTTLSDVVWSIVVVAATQIIMNVDVNG